MVCSVYRKNGRFAWNILEIAPLLLVIQSIQSPATMWCRGVRETESTTEQTGPEHMTKTTRALIAGAAIAGLFSGTTARAYSVSATKPEMKAGAQIQTADDDKG